MADQTKKGSGPLKPLGTAYTATTVETLRVEQGFAGQRFPGNDAPSGANLAPSHDHQVTPPGFLKIIWFGKMHYVSPALFARDSEKYNEFHWREAWLLIDELHGQQMIYDEWANPTAFIEFWVSKTVDGWRGMRDGVKSWFTAIESVEKPDPAEFFALVMRTYGVIERMAKYEKLHPVEVAQDGLDLAIIRADEKALLKAVVDYRDAAVKSAEQVTGGLETVESLAFQILNLYPTLTMMDPIREAIYKVYTMMLQATARGAGEALASDSKEWQGKWKAARQGIIGIVKQKAPEIVADVVMIPLNKFMLVNKFGKFEKGMVVVWVRNLVEFAGDYIWLVVENDGENLTEQQLDALIRKRLEAIVGSVLSEIPFLQANPGTKIGMTVVKSVVDTVIRVLWSEILSVRESMKVSHKTLQETLISDLPTILMRLFEGIVMGVLQRRAAAYAGRVQATVRNQPEEVQREALDIAHRDGLGWVKGKVPHEEIAESVKSRYSLHKLSDAEYNERYFHAKMIDPRLAKQGKNPVYDEGQIFIEQGLAERLERSARIHNVYYLLSNPNKYRLMHLASEESLGAKAEKPMYCKGKSSDSGELGENNGLVFFPTEVKDSEGKVVSRTHKDMEKARETWFGMDPVSPDPKKTNDKVFYQNGGMVREDGLAFHPDMLKRWGTLHPDAKADCASAIKTLHKLQGEHGICNLALPESQKRLGDLVKSGLLTQAEVDTMTRTLAAANMGFISDPDGVLTVDAATFEVIPVGKSAKTMPLEDLMRDQMNAMNRREQAPLDPELASIQGPSTIMGAKPYANAPGARDPHQHGNFGESGYDLFGEVLGIGPGSPAGAPEVFIMKSRLFKTNPDGSLERGPDGEPIELKEEAIKRGEARMKPGETERDAWKKKPRGHFSDLKEQVDEFFKDKGATESVFDAALHVSAEPADKNRAVRKSSKLRPVRASTGRIEKNLDLHDGVEVPDGVPVLDEPGLSEPVSELDITNALIHRGLQVDDHYVKKFTGEWTYEDARKRNVVLPSPRELTDARFKYRTFLGVDEKRENLVIAVQQYRQTMGEAVAALLRTRIALGPIWPYSEDGVERKIWYEIYSAYQPVSIDFVKGRVGGPSPGIPGPYDDLKHDGEWIASCFQKASDKALKNSFLYAFAANGACSSYTPDANRYGPFQGLMLQDVWETKNQRNLVYRPTKSNEAFFTFFPSAPIDSLTLVRPSKRALPKKKAGAVPSGSAP